MFQKSALLSPSASTLLAHSPLLAFRLFPLPKFIPPWDNRWLLGAIATSMALHAVILYVPAAGMVALGVAGSSAGAMIRPCTPPSCRRLQQAWLLL